MSSNQDENNLTEGINNQTTIETRFANFLGATNNNGQGRSTIRETLTSSQRMQGGTTTQYANSAQQQRNYPCICGCKPCWKSCHAQVSHWDHSVCKQLTNYMVLQATEYC